MYITLRLPAWCASDVDLQSSYFWSVLSIALREFSLRRCSVTSVIAEFSGESSGSVQARWLSASRVAFCQETMSWKSANLRPRCQRIVRAAASSRFIPTDLCQSERILRCSRSFLFLISFLFFLIEHRDVASAKNGRRFLGKRDHLLRLVVCDEFWLALTMQFSIICAQLLTSDSLYPYRSKETIVVYEITVT